MLLQPLQDLIAIHACGNGMQGQNVSNLACLRPCLQSASTAHCEVVFAHVQEAPITRCFLQNPCIHLAS